MNPIAVAPYQSPEPRARVTWLGVLSAEWTKFTTVRGGYVAFAVALFLLWGLAWLFAFGTRAAIGENAAEAQLGLRAAGVDAVAVSLNGVFLAQIAIAVLGVLSVSGEYASGMIRASFAAVPRRSMVVLSKAVLIVVLTLLVMGPGAFLAFAIAQSMLSETYLTLPLLSSEALRAVAGAAIYMAAVGAMGVAVGFILKNGAGAIATLIGALAVLPTVLAIMPIAWLRDLADYLPSNAGRALYSLNTRGLMDMLTAGGEAMGPLMGLLVIVAWVVALLAIAVVLVAARDA